MEIGDFLVGAVDAVGAGFFVRLSLLFSFSPNGSVSISLEGIKSAFVGCTFNVLKMS